MKKQDQVRGGEEPPGASRGDVKNHVFICKRFSRHQCLSAKPDQASRVMQQGTVVFPDDCSQAPARLFKIAHSASEPTDKPLLVSDRAYFWMVGYPEV